MLPRHDLQSKTDPLQVAEPIRRNASVLNNVDSDFAMLTSQTYNPSPSEREIEEEE